MNDDDVTRLLGRRAERVSADVVPVEQVIDSGRAGLRRRRRVASGGTAVLAVAAIVGGVVIQQAVVGGPAVPDPDRDLVAADVLDPPDGTRLVGEGRVVVAVPVAWSTGGTRCLKPIADTVYVETGAMTDCSGEPTDEELRAASSLALSTAALDYGFMRVDEMAAADPVDGVEVLEAPVDCSTRGTPQRCSQEFAVPSEGVAFRVSITARDARAQVDAVRDSLRILPRGYTAVPMSLGRDPVDVGMPVEHVDRLASVIEESGLRVERVEEHRAGMDPGSYVGSQPALGTPLAVGETVKLVVAADRAEDGKPPSRGASTIPSVFAYDADSAEALLTGLTLAVTREPERTCTTPGRAVRTRPAAGTGFEPGDEVTLLVTRPSLTADCIDGSAEALAWELLDFANRRGPAPRFASEVTVYVDGEVSALSGGAAADRDAWPAGSAVDVLAEATRQEYLINDSPVPPHLLVNEPEPINCQPDLPAELAARQSLSVGISPPTDGFVVCGLAHVFESEAGIDAIVVPSSGAGADDSVEPDPDPDGVGADFLAYARGRSDTLPVAPSVRLYLGNEYRRTLAAEDIDEPGAWNLCAPYAERSCPMSPLTALRQLKGQPSVTDFLPDSCVDTKVDAATDTEGTAMVVLGEPEPLTCAQDFEVQIWSDDEGRITAVNLLFGSP